MGDADVDLSAWAGQSVNLQLKTESGHEGDVVLWGNPVVTTPPKKRRPNILVYTIDTLRADHASVCGYSRNTTPFLSNLAKSGIVFDDCQAQATWTKSSIASLMTSLYSFTHGIVSDADTIPGGASTLAGQLRAAGYVTASIVSTPSVGRATGLERGFDYLLEYPVVLRQVSPQTDRATDSEALNRVVCSRGSTATTMNRSSSTRTRLIRTHPTNRRHPLMPSSPTPLSRLFSIAIIRASTRIINTGEAP